MRVIKNSKHYRHPWAAVIDALVVCRGINIPGGCRFFMRIAVVILWEAVGSSGGRFCGSGCLTYCKPWGRVIIYE